MPDTKRNQLASVLVEINAADDTLQRASKVLASYEPACLSIVKNVCVFCESSLTHPSPWLIMHPANDLDFVEDFHAT